MNRDITRTLELLEELHTRCPDLRFWQFLSWLQYEVKLTSMKADLFYMENDETNKVLEKILIKLDGGEIDE